MKTFPAGSKVIRVRTDKCVTTFDVMAVNGHADGEKCLELADALTAGHYLKNPDEGVLKAHTDGRLSLSLPEGFCYPPTVGELSNNQGGYELLDGRTAWEVYKDKGITSIVVVMTPITSMKDAIKEALLCNRPATGIKRAQVSKEDMLKSIRILVAQENFTVQQVKEHLGPIFMFQKSAFIQACREVGHDENTRRNQAAAAEVRMRGISVKEAAKNWDTSVTAVKKQLKQDVEGKAGPIKGFNKDLGNAVQKALLSLKKTHIAKMERGLTEQFLRGARLEKDINEGLRSLRQHAEQVLSLLCATQRRFSDLSRRATVAKAAAAAAGTP